MVCFTNSPPHRYLILPPSPPLCTSWLLPAPPHPSLPLLSVPCRVCSEKHREKSREAARSQGEKESEVFTQLALQLPLPLGAAQQLDKASIVRLTLSNLCLRELLHTEAGCGEVDNEVERTAPVETSIEGFLLLLSQDGVIIYTSEEVTRHTSLSQATSTSVLQSPASLSGSSQSAGC
ncbi:hypoxia-inducible factor 1-alpha-like isoform X2 [Acipenser ruthenus]|uniref:hypoxia-inducible factor 1-alpha-like isoform X2 n=1 Tax=Acipenser ruthenus TaxID=7906 RepID=UPI0027414223|nr:hypoxia-inducible factor 1-alpha-like isoform X2 [Acipenser ruthenus]